MKKHYIWAILPLILAGPSFAASGDDELKACHDAAWNQVEFSDLPNAAVSVFLSSKDENGIVAYWIVDWEGQQVAGTCVVPMGGTTQDAVELTWFGG